MATSAATSDSDSDSDSEFSTGMDILPRVYSALTATGAVGVKPVGRASTRRGCVGGTPRQIFTLALCFDSEGDRRNGAGPW